MLTAASCFPVFPSVRLSLSFSVPVWVGPTEKNGPEEQKVGAKERPGGSPQSEADTT